MRTYFGKMPDGQEIYNVSLENGPLRCDVITYGASLRTLTVPDRNGQPRDVVLGFDTEEDYLRQGSFIGASVGRFANRIAKGRFRLNGKDCAVDVNEGENHLHGGRAGFHTKVWNIENETPDSVTLGLVSPDGDCGYPGNLKVSITYSLLEDALCIRYNARSDADTLCNLTNHSYFNLSGHDYGSLQNHRIRIFADCYTPVGSGLIPTGEYAPVSGTPLDLRDFTDIPRALQENSRFLKITGGFDHNFVLRSSGNGINPAAELVSDESGILMQVETTLPALQFYSGNGLSVPPGKNGAAYGDRCACCLETQYDPDSPNHDNFSSAVLRADDTYNHTTVYRFRHIL